MWYICFLGAMQDEKPRKTPLVFYRSGSGAEPVRAWLKALDVTDRLVVGQDLMRAQWRWPVGMPLCRPMGQGLWEVRTDLAGNRIGPGADLPRRGRARGAARFHQENAEDTGR